MKAPGWTALCRHQGPQKLPGKAESFLQLMAQPEDTAGASITLVWALDPGLGLPPAFDFVYLVWWDRSHPKALPLK